MTARNSVPVVCRKRLTVVQIAFCFQWRDIETETVKPPKIPLKTDLCVSSRGRHSINCLLNITTKIFPESLGRLWEDLNPGRLPGFV